MENEPTPRPWLEKRLEEVNKPKIGLARFLGIHNSRIHEMIAGTRKIFIGEVDPIAKYLEWTREELLQHETGVSSASSEIAPMEGVVLDYEHKLDLPLYGAEDLGGGLFSMSSKPVRYIERAPPLRGIEAAYAVYCAEDSQAPRYERGETIVIDPTRPVAPGNDVLLISRDGKSRCVRRLIAILPNEWRVQQLTPPRIYEISKADFPTAHKVFGSRTL